MFLRLIEEDSIMEEHGEGVASWLHETFDDHAEIASMEDVDNIEFCD
jgi:hypothetical protein